MEKLQVWLPVLGLAVAAFVFNTSEFLPVGLLPEIAKSLDISIQKTGLVMTGYAWVVAIASLPLTVLTARLERKKLLLWLLVIFCLSHVLVLWACTFELLLGARICVALTHAIFWSIMTPLAARMAPYGKGPLGLAIVQGGSIVATVLGVPIGTQLGLWIGWQNAFFVVGIVAAMVWLLLFVTLPLVPSKKAGSLASLPVILKRPALLQIYLLTMVIVLGQFTVYSYITPVLANLGHLDSSAIIFVLFVYGISGIIGTVFCARFIDHHPNTVFLSSMIILGTSMALLAATCTSLPALVPLVVFWGAAMTAVCMCLQVFLLRTAHDATDVATSLFSGIFNVGIGGGAFLGGMASAQLGYGSLGYIGFAMVLAAFLLCLAVFLRRGEVLWNQKTSSAESGE
jgi:DHA1 family L-arabinose/isopropyl-beta-D-thiogalactopyranoside export protein-like MFS transporter